MSTMKTVTMSKYRNTSLLCLRTMSTVVFQLFSVYRVEKNTLSQALPLHVGH